MTNQGAEQDPTASAKATRLPEVSPNNPCPFLRALVAEGYLGGHLDPLSTIADTIARCGGKTNGDGDLSKRPVYLIGLIANGLSPAQLWRNAHQGVQLDGLRDGPLDGSGRDQWGGRTYHTRKRSNGLRGFEEADTERDAGRMAPEDAQAASTQFDET